MVEKKNSPRHIIDNWRYLETICRIINFISLTLRRRRVTSSRLSGRDAGVFCLIIIVYFD